MLKKKEKKKKERYKRALGLHQMCRCPISVCQSQEQIIF